MNLYLDASVIVPTLIAEAGTPAADRLISTHSGTLIVSDFAGAEVASVFSRLVRTKHLSSEQAHARLADFDEWRELATTKLDIIAADIRLAAAFVRRFDLMLRTPDALHLAVCRRVGCTLATFDQRLRDAARALDVGVMTSSG